MVLPRRDTGPSTSECVRRNSRDFLPLSDQSCDNRPHEDPQQPVQSQVASPWQHPRSTEVGSWHTGGLRQGTHSGSVSSTCCVGTRTDRVLKNPILAEGHLKAAEAYDWLARKRERDPVGPLKKRSRRSRRSR